MTWFRSHAEGWLKVVTGNAPILLTFPHAGLKRLKGVMIDSTTTKRVAPPGSTIFNTNRDRNTEIIAESILDHLDWQGIVPYMVVAEIDRKDMDLNRTWTHNLLGYRNGGVGNSTINKAQTIYNDFYDQIEAYTATIERRWPSEISNKAFHFDIHGTSIGSGCQIEFGTRNGSSADKTLVYGSPEVSLSPMQALQQQGFTFAGDAATNNVLEGSQILSVFGRNNDRLQSVQVELDRSIRGLDSPQGDIICRNTGQRIGKALSALLRQNNYPIEYRSPQRSNEEEIFTLWMS